MTQEYPPQEHFENYQQGYQPAHDFEQPSYNNTQGYQPMNNPEGPSYGPQAQVYQPLNVPVSAQGANVLFPTPLPHNDARFVAVLTYSLGWFSGLLFTLFTRENRYVRFHALQSLIFFGGINVLDIAFMFVGFGMRHYGFIPVIGPVLFLGFLLLNVIAFVGWLVAIVQAYRGTYYRLPLVGDMVARSFNMQPPLK